MKNSTILPTIYTIGFFSFLGQSVLFPVMPLYATHLGASVSQVGLIVSLSAYSPALFMIPFGLLSDRFGRRIFLIAGLVLTTLASILYVFTTTPLQLAIVRAIQGFGIASHIPTVIALVFDLASTEQRGKAIGWYTTITQAGLTVGPIVGGIILNSFGYTLSFLSAGIFSLIGLIIVLLRLELIPKKEVPEFTLNKTWGWLKQPAFYGAILTAICSAAGIGVLGAFIPIYSQGFGISAIGAGLIITLSFASSAILRLPAGTFSDRVGRKPMIMVGLAISALMIAVISMTHSLPLLSIVAFCFGIGIGILQPTSLALTADLSPDETRGLATGIYTSCFQFGNALGPTVMGIVAGVSSLPIMFIACGACMALGLLTIIVLFRIKGPSAA